MFYRYSTDDLVFKKISTSKLTWIITGIITLVIIILMLLSRYSHQNGFKVGSKYALEHMLVEEKPPCGPFSSVKAGFYKPHFLPVVQP